MKFATRSLLASLLLAPLSASLLFAETPATLSITQTPLPTGRHIAQHPDDSASIGSMPQQVLLTPDRQFAITTSSGFRDHLTSLRVSDGKPLSTIDYPSEKKESKSNGLYYGLALAPDRTLYAAQGAHHTIAVLHLNHDGTLHPVTQLTLRNNDFPTGLALDSRGRLFITHNDPDTPGTHYGTPASMSIVDPKSGQELGRYTFATDLGLSNFPFAVAVTSDGSRAFVGSERDSAVYVLNTADPAHISLVATLSTGANPTTLLFNKSQSTLYVANSNSDTVSIVDTASLKITGTLLLRPQIARDLAGATPIGLALSENEKRLYVTLADMNAVAVVDLAEEDGPEVEGYIPVGWYPTAVAVAGKTLLISNGKGDFPRIPHNFSKGKSVTSPLWLFEGTLWRLPIPHGSELSELTSQTLQNARLTAKYLRKDNPLEAVSKNAGKIQHVLYVVKENRTYDQVLGDLPQGNGDPSRCLFGRDITPNEHALAQRFVLLDNFYDSGDVSGDGWVWSTQAYANEYTVRNVPYNYSGRGRTFDFEGTNNGYPTGGFPAKDLDGKPLSNDPRFKNGGPAVPDVAASPGGHLWDLARKHGLSYRNFGFYVTGGAEDGPGSHSIPNNYPDVPGLQPGGHDLAGITDVDFRCFDLAFPDSDAPSTLAKKLGDRDLLWAKHHFGKDKLPSRFAEWKKEFDLMLAKDPTGNAVPNLMTIRFGTDHTMGASPGRPTPRCMVADNDYAVGELIDAVSHSPIWKSTAIVIIEDDAQNGPDHVDAHRSICFVVSPWIKKSAVDHSFQNTVSAIHTIECLLNLPPMCQYDAAAPVIGDWDDSPSNAAPYTAIFPNTDLMKERNPKSNRELPRSPENPGGSVEAPKSTPDLNSTEALAEVSATLDFSRADQVPADLLNRIIWKTVRGPKSEMPPTPHVIGHAPAKSDDDD